MANTPVQLDFNITGATTLVLKLFALDNDTLANTGGDAFAEETNRKGTYVATVADALSGTYLAKVFDGSTYLASGYVEMLDTTETCYIKSDKPESSVVSSLSEEAITAIAQGIMALDDAVETGQTFAETQEEILTTIRTLAGGTGSVLVDHNYNGTDNYRVVSPEGAGVIDVSILIYLKDDYDNDRRTHVFVKGRTTTDVNGRWHAPIYLDPETYTFVFAKLSGFQTAVTDVVVA